MQLLRTLIKKDQDVILAWHRLNQGKELSPHVHDDCDVFILFGNGNITLLREDREEEIDVINTLQMAEFNKGTKHGIRNRGRSAFEYFVIKIPK